MGYWLEDADGEWLGDFATNKGIVEMRKFGVSALNEFLDVGEASEELAKQIVVETKKLPELKYVGEMLSGASAPVFVTDGGGKAEE